MKYKKIQDIKDEQFKRLTGIKRETFKRITRSRRYKKKVGEKTS